MSTPVQIFWLIYKYVLKRMNDVETSQRLLNSLWEENKAKNEKHFSDLDAGILGFKKTVVETIIKNIKREVIRWSDRPPVLIDER